MPSRVHLSVLAVLLAPACVATDGTPPSQDPVRPVGAPAEAPRRDAPDSWVVLERVRDAILVDLREGEVVRARGRAATVLGVVRVLPSDPRARILDDIERLDAFAASLSAGPAPVR